MGKEEQQFIDSLPQSDRELLESADVENPTDNLFPEDAAAITYERISSMCVMGGQISEQEHERQISTLNAGH
jgi:hypothetical protein